MKEKIYKISPNIIQNLMISLYNFLAYKKRYGKDYYKYLKTYNKNEKLSYDELKAIQAERYKNLVLYTIAKSKFYKNLYSQIQNPEQIENISSLPIINKETLRKNINDIYTVPKSKAHIAKTGGTTGKSLEVRYIDENTQEGFAMLDNFRHKYGYKLGKKTAWFSGKALLTNRDIKKNRFWKTDYLYKVRYYSTFHIQPKYLKYYLENLIKYQPEYFVGFPSTMMEIAKYGIANNIKFPKNVIKAIFPAAETITDEIRATLMDYFNTELYDQYASSEGAPFIFECANHKLHLELQSGVFEVLDDKNNDTTSGRLVVTSFTTHGTPLIRYDIGDKITLSGEKCSCGNNNPVVKSIDGRIDDFIYSPETGKINLGNITNVLKGVYGVQKFQVIQNQINSIDILMMTDDTVFNDKSKNVFINNWRDRVGNNMTINLIKTDDIPNEKSGKFRIVKNNIKHLL